MELQSPFDPIVDAFRRDGYLQSQMGMRKLTKSSPTRWECNTRVSPSNICTYVRWEQVPWGECDNFFLGGITWSPDRGEYWRLAPLCQRRLQDPSPHHQSPSLRCRRRPHQVKEDRWLGDAERRPPPNIPCHGGCPWVRGGSRGTPQEICRQVLVTWNRIRYQGIRELQHK